MKFADDLENKDRDGLNQAVLDKEGITGGGDGEDREHEESEEQEEEVEEEYEMEVEDEDASVNSDGKRPTKMVT